MSSKQKILVAMSGGVDSSVAAAVLREAGHEVVGVFMRLGVETEEPSCDPSTSSGSSRARSRDDHRGCCSAADAADARVVAGRLGVPFYVLNFAEQFDALIDHFVAEYNRGRTPNPCVTCNSDLKFGHLFDYADMIGADAVATGHYARVVDTPGGRRLARGRDAGKDQSYVLFGVSPAMVDRMVLPLGDWTKDRVRDKAAELGLTAVAGKPDSQDICFVPGGDYARVVRGRTPEAVTPGRVVDLSGQVLGEHPGHQHFTIGQRRGLGIAAGEPIYVNAIDPASNTVTVGPADALRCDALAAGEVNWLDDAARASAEGPGLRAHVKIRYNAATVPATVRADGAGRVAVAFDEPVSAVTPGQAVVFYNEAGHLLGGGWID